MPGSRILVPDGQHNLRGVTSIVPIPSSRTQRHNAPRVLRPARGSALSSSVSAPAAASPVCRIFGVKAARLHSQ
jgi:hypothetical protein